MAKAFISWVDLATGGGENAIADVRGSVLVEIDGEAQVLTAPAAKAQWQSLFARITALDGAVLASAGEQAEIGGNSILVTVGQTAALWVGSAGTLALASFNETDV